MHGGLLVSHGGSRPRRGAYSGSRDIGGMRVSTGLVLLGVGAAAVAIPKLVSVVNRRWFSDVEAMDEDYPRDSTDTSWGAGGGHLGL